MPDFHDYSDNRPIFLLLKYALPGDAFVTSRERVSFMAQTDGMLMQALAIALEV